MDNSMQKGGYLAPEIGETELLARTTLCESGYIEDHTYIDPWAA